MARFYLEDRVHADQSGFFCKCIICLDCQETVVNMETHFLIFSFFLYFFQAIYAFRQMHLYLCILLSCLMFVKERNTQNNSRKVLAIPLHDNSNMSALDPAQRGALVIIRHLAVLMFFYNFPVEKGEWVEKRGKGGKISPVLAFLLLAPWLFLPFLSILLFPLISALIRLNRLSIQFCTQFLFKVNRRTEVFMLLWYRLNPLSAKHGALKKCSSPSSSSREMKRKKDKRYAEQKMGERRAN